MNACIQIFKSPFYFAGWMAPAYGKGEVNSNGITKGKESRTMKVAFNLRGSLAFAGWMAPAYGKGEANSCGITFKCHIVTKRQVNMINFSLLSKIKKKLS